MTNIPSGRLADGAPTYHHGQLIVPVLVQWERD